MLGIIALAIVWGLVATGVWNDILKYRKDIVYLTKQHLVLVGVSGSAAIVTGVLIGIWLSRPWMARYAEATIQVGQHGDGDPHARQARAHDDDPRHRRAAGDRRAVDRDAAADHPQHLRRASSAVPAPLVDAARGMGMSPGAILRRVELPNALFVIFAGVRTAMAINVGTAPIAFLIGGGGLGELIFTGIDLQEFGMMLAGAIPTALLAVMVDFLFGQAQYWLVPRGVNPLRNS